MASVEHNPVVCLRCGESIQRSLERRKVASSSSFHVVPLWKKNVISATKVCITFMPTWISCLPDQDEQQGKCVGSAFILMKQ